MNLSSEIRFSAYDSLLLFKRIFSQHNFGEIFGFVLMEKLTKFGLWCKVVKFCVTMMSTFTQITHKWETPIKLQNSG